MEALYSGNWYYDIMLQVSCGGESIFGTFGENGLEAGHHLDAKVRIQDVEAAARGLFRSFSCGIARLDKNQMCNVVGAWKNKRIHASKVMDAWDADGDGHVKVLS